jgi:hypothetical protein
MIRNGQGTSGDARTCNHIQAIINGGPNRESNLHPLCEWCEPAKTEADVHRSRGATAGGSGTFASGWKRRGPDPRVTEFGKAYVQWCEARTIEAKINASVSSVVCARPRCRDRSS